MDKLIEECKRLSLCSSLEDSQETLDVFIDCIYQLILNHHKDKLNNPTEEEAKLVLQMIFSKLCHIRKLIDGVDYVKNGKFYLKKLVDPTIIACLIRNLYETVCAFHVIFISPKNNDEHIIIYKLWVIAGQSFRQRFASNVQSSTSQSKLDEELKQIQQFKIDIENNNKYKLLNPADKDKIQIKIKSKDYKIWFDGNEVKFLDWKDIPELMSCKGSYFENMYTYFSLYSHPSFVSVYQFADLFDKDNKDFLMMTTFNLKFAFIITSIFLADYLKLFPTNLSAFEKMDIRDQFVINFFNKNIRGDAFSINDVNKRIVI
ncbi:MAG: hypothetical protein IPO86_00125 [Saprospiraceae bacterium]|nr:hypothetical protein [Saprospiraceae bacterium]